MINPSFSCKGCPDRYPGCHGKCEKYIREKVEFEERKRMAKVQEDLDSAAQIRYYRNKDYYAKKNKGLGTYYKNL